MQATFRSFGTTNKTAPIIAAFGLLALLAFGEGFDAIPDSIKNAGRYFCFGLLLSSGGDQTIRIGPAGIVVRIEPWLRFLWIGRPHERKFKWSELSRYSLDPVLEAMSLVLHHGPPIVSVRDQWRLDNFDRASASLLELINERKRVGLPTPDRVELRRTLWPWPNAASVVSLGVALLAVAIFLWGDTRVASMLALVVPLLVGQEFLFRKPTINRLYACGAVGVVLVAALAYFTETMLGVVGAIMLVTFVALSITLVKRAEKLAKVRV